MNKGIVVLCVFVISFCSFCQVFQAFRFDDLLKKEDLLYDEQVELFEKNRRFVADIAGIYVPSVVEELAIKNSLNSDSEDKIVVKILLDSSGEND